MIANQPSRKSRPAADQAGTTGKRKPANYINADATVWARLRPIKNHARRGLLIVIAGCADRHTLQCWPSQQFLALHSGQSERTVRTQLAELVEDGFIKIEHRRDGAGQRIPSLITLLIDPADDVGTGTCPPANSEGPPAKNPAIHRQTWLPVIKEEKEKQLRTSDEGSSEARPEPNSPSPDQPIERQAGRVEIVDRPYHEPAPIPPRDVIDAKAVEVIERAYPGHHTFTETDRAEGASAFRQAVMRGIDPDLIIWAAFYYRAEVQRGGRRPEAPVWWMRKQRWNDQAGIELFVASASDPKERKRLMAVAQAQSCMR